MQPDNSGPSTPSAVPETWVVASATHPVYLCPGGVFRPQLNAAIKCSSRNHAMHVAGEFFLNLNTVRLVQLK